MSRALDLDLQPKAHKTEGLRLNTYTYGYFPSVRFVDMREHVCLDVGCGVMNAHTTLTPDEARVLANQLLQVADQCDEHKARRESLEEIEEELRDPDRNSRCVHYVHPDVVYAEPGRMVEVCAANPGKLVIALQHDDDGAYQGGVGMAAQGAAA